MILGVLLAGGQSARMGRDKAGVVVDGTTLAERAIATLREVCEDVVIVGHGRGCPPLPRIDDDGVGPAGALRAVLSRHPTAIFVVLPVDMPLIRAAHLRILLDALADRRAAIFDGEPLPLVVRGGRVGADAKLMKLIDEWDPVRVPIREQRIFANVNTPAELEALLRDR